jgi:8-oxo-dGTP diphosphatase
MATNNLLARIADVDWKTWVPKERGTLCFIVRHGQILLIRKKRGLGAGKINGPGGRIDPGETALQGAIRETQEEIGITPKDPFFAGEMSFVFLDGYSLHCSVYGAADYEGELKETDEATPIWYDIHKIPYHEMWSDDAYWMPLFLDRKPFAGYFIFDQDRMVDHRIDLSPV